MVSNGYYVRAGRPLELVVTRKLGSALKEEDVVWKMKCENTEEELSDGKGKYSFLFTPDKKYENKRISITAYFKNERFSESTLWNNTSLTPDKVIHLYVLPKYMNYLVKTIGNNSGITGKYYAGDLVKLVVNEYDVPVNQVPSEVRQSVQWHVRIGEGNPEVLLVDDTMFAGEKIQFRVPSEWSGKRVLIMACVQSPVARVSVALEVKGFPMVIDIYKMPGLDDECRDIADDMTFGTGHNPYAGAVYKEEDVEDYKLRYASDGLDEEADAVFTNAAEYDPLDKSVHAKAELLNSWRKAKYSRTDVTNIASANKAYGNMEEDMLLDDNKLFQAFIDMCVSEFACNHKGMAENIQGMIKKFRANAGGVYQNNTLNAYVDSHPSTRRYCAYVDKYIKKMLQENSGELRKLEDERVYDKPAHDVIKAKNDRKGEENGKNKSEFLTPLFPGDPAPWGKEEHKKNIREGITIAVNDVWAARIDLMNYSVHGDQYELAYRVTLWDHFGLDRADLFGKWTHYWMQGFRAWLILQHIRGYKPFVTKMTVNRTIYGNLKP